MNENNQWMGTGAARRHVDRHLQRPVANDDGVGDAGEGQDAAIVDMRAAPQVRLADFELGGRHEAGRAGAVVAGELGGRVRRVAYRSPLARGAKQRHGEHRSTDSRI